MPVGASIRPGTVSFASISYKGNLVVTSGAEEIRVTTGGLDHICGGGQAGIAYGSRTADTIPAGGVTKTVRPRMPTGVRTVYDSRPRRNLMRQGRGTVKGRLLRVVTVGGILVIKTGVDESHITRSFYLLITISLLSGTRLGRTA